MVLVVNKPGHLKCGYDEFRHDIDVGQQKLRSIAQILGSLKLRQRCGSPVSTSLTSQQLQTLSEPKEETEYLETDQRLRSASPIEVDDLLSPSIAESTPHEGFDPTTTANTISCQNNEESLGTPPELSNPATPSSSAPLNRAVKRRRVVFPMTTFPSGDGTARLSEEPGASG